MAKKIEVRRTPGYGEPNTPLLECPVAVAGTRKEVLIWAAENKLQFVPAYNLFNGYWREPATGVCYFPS